MKKQPKKQDRPGLDILGRTPLHYAASDGSFSEAELLLQGNANPNAKDDNGWTPLHFAAQSGSVEIATLLLQVGAEANAIDSNGNTPLFRAVFCYVGEGSLIEALRGAGADPYKENKYGTTPIGLAREIANYDVRKFFGDLP